MRRTASPFVASAMMEVDRRARLLNQRRLRDLVAQGEAIDVVCAHDPGELATRRTAVRAPALVK